MTYQIQSYLKDHSGIKAKIVEYLLDNRATIAEIGEALKIQNSTVSARVNELLQMGCLVVHESDSGRVHTYDPNKANWEARAERIKKEKDLEGIHKFVTKYGPKMTDAGKHELRKLYVKIRQA